MDEVREKLAKLVNASGFAFQLAVEAAVRESEASRRWDVHAREYPWRTNHANGFVDLILRCRNYYLVVECKRQRQAEWVFLLPDARQRSRTHARVKWTDTAVHRKPLTDWGDIQIDPGSPEPEFCIVRGQGEKDTPLLERLAGHLLESVEAVSADLLIINEQENSSCVIVPMIVTTARLYLCEFDPRKVDLSNGDVAEGTYVEVPSVRFRKSLAATSVPLEYEPDTLTDLSAGSERTVFVVNAEHLVHWLSEFRTRETRGATPWEMARAQAEAMGT